MDAELPNERAAGANQKAGSDSRSMPLTWITLLLVLILLTQLFQTFTTWQRSAAHARKVEQARELVDKQQTLILGLMDSYRKDAYGNTSVDRIAEQQLIAMEYSLSALQVMAIQNSQIIQLLADAP